MKIKITDIEFDWDIPAGDPFPPDYELYNNIGAVVDVPADWVEDIWEYISDVWLDPLFPIRELEWEVLTA
jgi:hypothetical protein